MKLLLLVASVLFFASGFSQRGIVGNKKNSVGVDYESNNQHDGFFEVGTIMKIKKSPAFVRYVNFIIRSNNYTNEIDFKINLYSLRDGKPDKSLLNEPITVTTKMKKGILTLSVEKYKIEVTDDFFLSLQWKEGKEPERIGFGGSLSGNKSYQRVDADGEWEVLPIMKLGFYADVLYR